LCETLADNDMSQILDVVPNHVGIMGGENRWWLDVLENGPASTYADYFDIDWDPLKPELRGKVLVPVLGGHYGDILDSGALKLVFSEGAFRVEYYEHYFPVDPREYPRILAIGLERLTERMGRTMSDLAAFESLVTAFGKLPARHERDADALIERRRDKEIHKQRLKELCAAIPTSTGTFGNVCVTSTGPKTIRRIRPDSMSCSNRKPIGWRTGGSPRTTSITVASSTSTTWPRCAWRIRGPWRPPIGWRWS
jgi:maltooligosyltrehalose synthase